jgi:putative flippase GtrA
MAVNDLTLHFLQDFFRKNQFFRFLLVGMLNTVFGYLLFAGMIYCGFHYVVASLVATCLGTLFNFRTYGRIVFRQTQRSLLWRFILVYVALYFFSIATIKIGTFFIQNLYVIGGISTLLMAALGYYLNKNFVFYRTCHEID